MDSMDGAGSADAAAGPVYTVGHSTRTAEELVGLLAAHGVELLVDVRRFPGSRRHPQFGRDALAAALAEAGIEYRHEEALGGRRSSEAGAASPNTAWRNDAFRAYADYTATPPFRRAVWRLMADAESRRVVIMCAEAVPWRCHRRLITDALLARGVAVLDILGPGLAAEAQLSPHAVVQADGGVIYPATAQQDLFGG
jgi:uncharacterized protein (DUF488 family)